MPLAQSTLARLIADPTAPLPASASKSERERVATLRTAYTTAMAARAERRTLTDPEALADLLAPMLACASVERMLVIPLDARCRLIGEPIPVSQGDVDGCDAGARLILRAALQAGAVSLAISHNHPTGDPSPSASDLAVTRHIAKASRIVGLDLVDHIIIGTGGIFHSIRRDNAECFAI